ncbi:hypothetical protein KR054_009591, partial [Drosophila jambulina]
LLRDYFRSFLSTSSHLDIDTNTIKVGSISLLKAASELVAHKLQLGSSNCEIDDLVAPPACPETVQLTSSSINGESPSLKIYFQNISGMRTKTEAVYLATSSCDYDVIILVETWLNIDFFDNEFFNANLYQVFHKDRDAVKTQCFRGGGVLIAVRRTLRCTSIRLRNDGSLLDQLCVSLAGPVETFLLVVSYIP